MPLKENISATGFQTRKENAERTSREGSLTQPPLSHSVEAQLWHCHNIPYSPSVFFFFQSLYLMPMVYNGRNKRVVCGNNISVRMLSPLLASFCRMWYDCFAYTRKYLPHFSSHVFWRLILQAYFPAMLTVERHQILAHNL